MDNQGELFPKAITTKNCERCAKRCRVVDRRNPDADLFVRGTAKTGKFCTECLVVDFFKNCDRGPAMAMGDDYFGADFDAECFRLPHMQKLFRGIVKVAAEQYGAELTFDEIDWDEVIANWHLPFPKTKQHKKRKRKGT